METNYLRKLRLDLGLTQQDLADRAYVTRSSVLRMEQLIPANPPTPVVKALSALTGITAVALISHYDDARTDMIESNLKRLTDAVDYTLTVSLAINYAIDNYSNHKPPFKLFRMYLFEHYGLPSSGIKFCQFVGLHPAALSEVETGKVDWTHTGGAFKDTLMNKLKISPERCELLGRAHDNYFLSL